MSNLIEDLRFFIGLFFVLIGLLLSAQGFFSPVDIAGFNPNLIVGICYVVFGVSALILVFRSRGSLKVPPSGNSNP